MARATAPSPDHTSSLGNPHPRSAMHKHRRSSTPSLVNQSEEDLTLANLHLVPPELSWATDSEDRDETPSVSSVPQTEMKIASVAPADKWSIEWLDYQMAAISLQFKATEASHGHVPIRPRTPPPRHVPMDPTRRIPRIKVTTPGGATVPVMRCYEKCSLRSVRRQNPGLLCANGLPHQNKYLAQANARALRAHRKVSRHVRRR